MPVIVFVDQRGMLGDCEREDMMANLKPVLFAVASALAFAISGCGGGGGGGVASVPRPPSPTPTPTPPPPPEALAVKIFDSPSTQQFAAYNAGPGELQVRYDAASQTYEVKADDWQWQLLRKASDQNAYDYEWGSSAPYNWMATNQSAAYKYTRLADWSTADYGITAFGIPTAANAMPVTGSATFDGIISGWSDAFISDQAPYALSRMNGSIQLSFDFGAGSLSGEIHPEMWSPHNDNTSFYTYDLGTIAFSNTVYSSGSPSFSGEFATNAADGSSFSGQFTGPNAEELMGEWALPFVWSDSGEGDGQVHWGAGVFIGKRP